MSTTTQSWKLYYWGGNFKGRGEYVRLMFTLAGVPYEEIGDPAEFVKLIDRSVNVGSYGESSYPAFAVPMIVTPEGDTISQTTAILAFLGKRFGYYPENVLDEFHALQICCTVADFHSEGRACFHPTDNAASYHSQVEAADAAAKKFSEGRLLVWLNHLNHLLEANTSNSGYFIGSKMTYADIAAFFVLSAAEFQFPDAWNSVNLPSIKAFVDRIKAIPAIAEYLNHPSTRPFSGNSML